MSTRRPALALLAALMLAPAMLPATALAQAWPDKPIKLVVGFPPGTGPDVVARTIGQKLGELAGQPLVVDNRPGAGGQISAQQVAKGAADGTTLLLAEVGMISIAPAAFRKLPYDPAKELVGVAEVVRSDFVLVVPLKSAAKTVAEFVAAAKAKNDKVDFVTFGPGTPGHFGAEVFGDQAGFKVEPLHFRSTGDAVTAIIAGDAQGAFVSTALAMAQVKGGKLRALATTAAQRSPLLPEVPTFTEAGFPKMDFSAWFAIMVPTATPAAMLEPMNQKVVAAVKSPEVRAKLQEAGFTVTGTSRADTERMLKAEAARWAAVVKATGFTGD
ncbi:MAG: tripartite tricarboxylate transporter substrate binding protein [Burkholderiales bacterium]|nr:tripartite tricarboxylate transporter substrate binding protein [Burkholderiales bacterium]